MKREILFRGKRIDTGEWVQGYFWSIEEHYNLELSNRHYIKSIKNGLDYEVIPETIGQFTGLTDKNGVKIFEGDIVRADWGYLGVVDFEDFIFAKGECRISEDIEVIGNIYDNHELYENGKV